MFGKISANYHLPKNSRNLDGESYKDLADIDVSIDLTNMSDDTKKVGSLKKRRTEPNDDDLLIATPIVYGFSLADKVWSEFKDSFYALLSRFLWDMC